MISSTGYAAAIGGPLQDLPIGTRVRLRVCDCITPLTAIATG